MVEIKKRRLFKKLSIIISSDAASIGDVHEMPTDQSA